jgi:N-acetylated-alpha-linked acidic dipeptidase
LGASRLWATHPHIAGSKEDYQDAKSVLEFFQTELGLESTPELPIFSAGSDKSQLATRGITNTTVPSAWIDTYYPVLNTPLSRGLDVIDEDGLSVFSADLVEDGDPRDPEASKYRDYIPTFHGLSAEGEATGQLVYVNYGTHEDYEALVKKGVNFKGKIVLARYGDVFRGLKVSYLYSLEQ